MNLNGVSIFSIWRTLIIGLSEKRRDSLRIFPSRRVYSISTMISTMISSYQQTFYVPSFHCYQFNTICKQDCFASCFHHMTVNTGSSFVWEYRRKTRGFHKFQLIKWTIKTNIGLSSTENRSFLWWSSQALNYRDSSKKCERVRIRIGFRVNIRI